MYKYMNLIYIYLFLSYLIYVAKFNKYEFYIDNCIELNRLFLIIEITMYYHNRFILQHTNAFLKSPNNNKAVFVVCYSVVDRESFRNVREFWIPSIKNLKKKHDIVIVATHVDLRESEDPGHVTFDEGFDLCKEVSGHAFIECSATDRFRTKQVFKSVVSSALAKKKTRFSVLRKFIGRWHYEKLSKFRPWNCCCNRWCKRSCDAVLITEHIAM